MRSENHQSTTNNKTELHNKCLSYRRVRAQEAIGEIEKERILLKQKLDIRNSDYEQKAQVWYQIVLLIFKPVVVRWLFKNLNNCELKIWFDMFEFDDLDLGVWRGETWVRLQACQDGHRGLLTRGLSWIWPQSMLIIGNTKLTHICSGDHQLNNCISSYVLFCSFSQVLLQMKRLETKMATMTEEKDKRISELQACKDQDIRYSSWNIIFGYYFK